jgi:hypothetical protein
LFNACSIANKHTTISTWISDNNLSLAAVVETWHNSADDPNLIACAPPTHHYIERARPRPASKANKLASNHGGVCLFYRKSLAARSIPLQSFTTFEVRAVYLQGALLTALVVTLYRPGSAAVTHEFFDEFSSLLEQIVIFSAPLIILGDFNIHMDDVTNTHTVRFNSILAANNLIQHVTGPTHGDGHTLDLIITLSDAVVSSIDIEPPVPDHSKIVAQLDVKAYKCTETTRITSRNWRSFNIDNFSYDLDHSNLVRNPPSDTTQLFATYDDTLKALLDKHAPFVTRNIRARPASPWYDATCRAMKAKTRRFEKIHRKLQTANTLLAWQKHFHQQRVLYQEKYKEYWLRSIQCSTSDPKALRSKLSVLLKPPSLPTTTSHTPDAFAEFFKTKIDNIRSNTASAPPPIIDHRDVTPLTEFEPVTDDEMLKLLQKSPAKHCSLDPVPTWLVKRLADRFAPIFTRLCNSSLVAGVVPVAHKHAVVRSSLKKPTLDPTDFASYRPISNLTFLSKTLERVVAAQFMKHADGQHLLPARQSAYRAHHSTETVIVSVHNDLVRAIDNGLVSALVLLDLSAAFDTVDHATLLDILHQRFGLDGKVLMWCRSYLADRSQSYIVGKNKTVSLPLTCGVPQGSSLGPQKFIAYAEGIAAALTRSAINYDLFADDVQLNASAPVDKIHIATKLLESCVADVADCCASRRLQLNPTKFEIAWFGSRANLRRIADDDARCLRISADTVIKPVDVVRNLGVLLDSELTMKQHVNKIASVCFFHLRRLRQLRRLLGPDVMKMLVSAFILSRLDYCNAVLAGLPKSTTDILQRVQNAAARLVLGLRPQDSADGALKQLHWMPIRYRIKYKLCVLMHGVTVHQSPSYITDIVTATSDIPTKAKLRSATNGSFAVPRTRTEFGKRAFSVAGPKQWNKLPVSVRSISNTETFKAKLKTELFRRAYKLKPNNT